MKRVGLAIFVAFFYIGGLLLFFSTYIKKDIKEMEQLKLSYAIDYASDAAIFNLLKSRDLQMDYADSDFLRADPNVALNTFVDIFLFNYGLPADETNRAHVRANFIPTLAVAMYDGFYIATPQLVENATDYPENPARFGIWDLVFGPKLPYTYKDGWVSYALNMGGETALRLDGNNLSTTHNRPPGLHSKEDVLREISSIISADMAYAINTINESNPNWANNFYIPSNLTTYSSVNPIHGPSILAIVQNVDLSTSTPIGAFSIAGSKIHNARMVAGYEKFGEKYYCYSDKIPEHFNVIQLFENVKDAAKAGYSHDMEYMNR